MDEIIALIRDLASAVKDLHALHDSGNFPSRQLAHKLQHIMERADRLLPENPHKIGLSPDRSPEEWDALVGRKP